MAVAVYKDTRRLPVSLVYNMTHISDFNLDRQAEAARLRWNTIGLKKLC